MSDANEQIRQIVYHTYYDLPARIFLTDGRRIEYYYSGAGELIKTEYFSAAGQSLERWEYIGDLVLRNGALFQVAVPDGRAVFANGSWNYELHYTDHLGNVRASINRQGQLISSSHFDPWGHRLQGLGTTAGQLTNRWELQGKERDLTFGLNRINFGARVYNPTIGVWDQVDALADHPNQVRFSPYTAFWNNPVTYTDPDGNCPSCPQGEAAAQVYSKGATVTNKDGSWTWTGTDWQVNQATQISDRQVASTMPVNIAFGMGAYAGLQQTGQFFSSLTTAQGWKDLGQGFANMAKMGNSLDPEGMMMRAETAMAVDAYTENIPNTTAGEVAYDLGYGSEKVAEAVLTRKVMPVTKASLGLKVLGKADKMTTPMSYAMQGKFGKLPFRVPTPLNGWGTASNDVGSVLTRNLIIPFGRTAPAQYIQKRK